MATMPAELILAAPVAGGGMGCFVDVSLRSRADGTPVPELVIGSKGSPVSNGTHG